MDVSMIAVGAGLGLGLAVLGAGIGQGIAAGNALSGVARQPEASGKMLTFMILGLALIESLFILTWLPMNQLVGKVPNYGEIPVEKLTSQNGAPITHQASAPQEEPKYAENR